MSRRVSGGFRVLLIVFGGVCLSISFSGESAWAVFVCANFVRMQFSGKISARLSSFLIEAPVKWVDYLAIILGLFTVG